MKHGELVTLTEQAYTPPDPRLVAALDKLSDMNLLLLRVWVDEERRAAADEEWQKQKPRIDEYERLQKKVAHGCTDAHCDLCDGKRAEQP